MRCRVQRTAEALNHCGQIRLLKRCGMTVSVVVADGTAFSVPFVEAHASCQRPKTCTRPDIRLTREPLTYMAKC